MMWLLSTRIGRSLASLGALLLAVLTFGVVQRGKGRKEGKEIIRRRAQAGAEDRKEERDEIDDDVRGVDAANELRSDWTRP